MRRELPPMVLSLTHAKDESEGHQQVAGRTAPRPVPLGKLREISKRSQPIEYERKRKSKTRIKPDQ